MVERGELLVLGCACCFLMLPIDARSDVLLAFCCLQNALIVRREKIWLRRRKPPSIPDQAGLEGRQLISQLLTNKVKGVTSTEGNKNRWLALNDRAGGRVGTGSEPPDDESDPSDGSSSDGGEAEDYEPPDDDSEDDDADNVVSRRGRGDGLGKGSASKEPTAVRVPAPSGTGDLRERAETANRRQSDENNEKAALPTRSYEKSEITGVRRDSTRGRWVASWYENGKQKTESFPAARLGEEGAKRAAIKRREDMEEKWPNQRKTAIIIDDDSRKLIAQLLEKDVKGVRFDERHCNRWVAYWSKGGTQHGKYFAINKHGGIEEAYDKAVACRREAEASGAASLQQPAERQSGHRGVIWDKAGKRWVARWTDASGEQKHCHFSLSTHGGDREAMAAAIRWRERMVEETKREKQDRQMSPRQRDKRPKAASKRQNDKNNDKASHPTKSPNNSSTAGLHRKVYRNVITKDVTHSYWVASWYENGKRKKEHFSVAMLGENGAKREAIRRRKDMEEKWPTQRKAAITLNRQDKKLIDQLRGKKVKGVHFDERHNRWMAAWGVGRKQRKKSFAISTNGSIEEAYEKAVAFRKEKEASGAASVRQPAEIQSGHIGVSWNKKRKAWAASWYDAAAKPQCHYFSVSAYGGDSEKAKADAIDWRETMVEQAEREILVCR
ncbi:unnamed protein product [Vitrella brassicaformis CCMP3155]|uniref:AP2/ERF domain-containing protein n=2 Tax=Vitrella brassicaformis TaxID=1169539 RepID=A0A0G4GS35_VITBC|nr:unnamed protein product [Vitrella brassicaformis CCMP3155]|eukprot:CEM33424.1 unnamed protein product [Vitrella brassicaformis CCMP3155]